VAGLALLALIGCTSGDSGTAETTDIVTTLDITAGDVSAEQSDHGGQPSEIASVEDSSSPDAPADSGHSNQEDVQDSVASQADIAPVDPLTQPEGILMGHEEVADWSAFQVNSYLTTYYTGLVSEVGVEVYHLLYSVQNPPGTSQAASALAVFPKGIDPANPPMVLSWNHGTTGGGDSCAPSAMGSAGTFYGIVFASLGYAVVLPDYPGLGTPGPHPYMVRDVTGMSVVDGVRALYALGETLGHPLSKDVASLGHSQGGHATMSAHEYFDPPYGEGLNYIGGVAYAPGGAFGRTFEEMAGLSPTPSPFLAMMWLSWLRREDLPPETVFRVPYDTQLADWVENYCLSQLTPLMPALNSLLYHDEVLEAAKTGYANHPVLGPIIEFNTAPKLPSETPLLIMQGEADTLVFPEIADWITEISCEVGTEVELRKKATRDHMTIVYVDMLKEGAQWLEARRAGEAWEGNCP